jgi:aminoglycoside/choline kinase family phosphotransferase
MVSWLSADSTKRALHLLVTAGLLRQNQAERALNSASSEQLRGDGSNRRFLRIRHLGATVCIMVVPEKNGKNDLEEARSAWLIGNHLRRGKVPLPELYGWDEETGILLFEDLGDCRLHSLVTRREGIDHLSWYFSTLKELAHMQVVGAIDFNTGWCWDSGGYDKKLMLERESGYFIRAFWQGLLGRESMPGVGEELEDIAARTAQAGNDFFLHRDFQCRNIMIKDGKVRFIDYQGGRMGPPGYDLASLLIDPYAHLSPEMTKQLFEYYISCLAEHIDIDRDLFTEHYNLLAFQRNMQIIGAFSFLYQVRKKVFFADYITPALSALDCRLQLPQFSDYPIIKGMVRKGIIQTAKQNTAGRIRQRRNEI